MQYIILTLSLLSCARAWSYFSCPGAPDRDVPTTCVSGFNGNNRNTLLSALNQVQPDLRVVTLNQYAWRAKQSGYAQIRDWLREVLPSTDIIAFQEFSEGDFQSVNRFMTGDNFRGRRFQQLETSNANPSLAIYATTDAQLSNGATEGYGWDNFNRNTGWADGYERSVMWGDVRIKGKSLKVANNHGCLGAFPDGQCSTRDFNCNSRGSNGKFDFGGCKNNGGPAIIGKLRENGFFENEGANSLFFCDCNSFSPPQLLCEEGMQVRGRLECGGPNLDFIGYGSNFELLAHYGFGGTASGGDSDHKSVILDLKFRDSPPVVDPSTCGNVPTQCDGHLNWALSTGRYTIPWEYPNFAEITGSALLSASKEDMSHYFFCESVQAASCRNAGLQPKCCGDVPCSCAVTSTPNGPNDDNVECSSGFTNVKLECGGCRVLTQDTSLHRTCDEFCGAQQRTCVAAFEEVANDCEIKDTLRCDTDFSTFTSDALCECSSSFHVSNPDSEGDDCPSVADARGLGFALSTGSMVNPLPPARVATIAKNANIKKFRLYGWDTDVEMIAAILQEVPDARFVIQIEKSQEVERCANSESDCLDVLHKFDAYSSTISHVAVGNEPLHAGTPFSKIASAIENVISSMQSLGWSEAKVTVPFSMSVLKDAYPVADAYLVEPSIPTSSKHGCDSGCVTASAGGTMARILSSIRDANGVFAIQAYPYFVAKSDASLLEVSLDATKVMHNQVAATKVALDKLGYGSMEVIITEVGWPTEGHSKATIENAQTFFRSLATARGGDPSLSFYDTDIFAFELFDESKKSGAADETHFGWFTEEGCKKFDISPDDIPSGPAPCVDEPIPGSCAGHLDWAMSTGRNGAFANSFYPNFESQTGVSLREASAEDMQLYFYCNSVQKNDCVGAGLALPCTCSSPPCGCGSSRRLTSIASPKGLQEQTHSHNSEGRKL